jgi:outer membrane protein W
VAEQLDFVPGMDLAFGNNATVVSVNGDFHYRLATKTTWRPYLGAGVGIHFTSTDNNGPSTDNSSTETGGHFIAGADVLAKGGSRFFTELKLGFSNSPDFKVAAGFNFAAR